MTSMRAIQVSALGGPDVLDLVQVESPEPGPGRVVVEVAAAGVNFIDVYQRTGLYQLDLPFVPGMEGAGRVVAVGDGVEDVAGVGVGDVAGVGVGDVVAWTDVSGSYAERISLPVERTVPVPEAVDVDTAAAVMLQGITAHYLVHSTFPLQAGHRCLVHAGAGGVGRLLVQMAKRIGAEVFTTVGGEDKAEVARTAGADHVILYRDVPFVEAVEAVAGPRPLDVVYDGVGAATFDGGLALLKPRATMVTFGNASGPVEPISPLVLSRNGSLFLTRPTMSHHIAERTELLSRAQDLFTWVEDGSLDVLVGARHPLEEAAEAHRALEGRSTTGKVLLQP